VPNYLEDMRNRKNSEISSAYELDELPCTHTALRQAARRLGHLYDEAVAPTGLKATQVGLLFQADRLGGVDGPTLNTLAERLALSISSLTYALRPLVRDGLMKLEQDKHDKRTKHASLTALGRKRLAEGIKLWTTANRRTELVLGHDSATQLRALADGISSRKFLDAYRAGRPAGSKRSERDA
jgi:DNA-binding MarR family transcriptional regulator